MAKVIKVKVIVTLDSSDAFVYEVEEKFDEQAYGQDLAEAVIKVSSMTVSDIVKTIVEHEKASA